MQIDLFGSTALSTPWAGNPATGAAYVQQLNSTGGAFGEAANPMFVRGRSVITGLTETVAPLASAGSITGAARDVQAASVGPGFCFFVATFYSDVAGTAFVEQSPDNVTWTPANGAAGTTLGAGNTVQIKVPLVTRYYRIRYVNGAGAQTVFAVFSNFTLN